MSFSTGYIHRGALSPVLWGLCKKRQTGVLQIDGPSGTWQAGLHRGRLSALSLPSAYSEPLLGELLIKNGFIAPRDLQTSLQEARKQGSLYGQVLVARGLSSEALWEALKAQSHQRFSRMLRHAWGSFSFLQGHRLHVEKGLGRPLNPLLEMQNRGPSNVESPPSFRTSKAPKERSCFGSTDSSTNVRRRVEPKTSPNKSPKEKTCSLRPQPSPPEGKSGDFHRRLKGWWRSMAKKYHPDSHVNADPQTRLLLAQRFMEAQATYRLCLKNGVLPTSF